MKAKALMLGLCGVGAAVVSAASLRAGTSLPADAPDAAGTPDVARLMAECLGLPEPYLPQGPPDWARLEQACQQLLDLVPTQVHAREGLQTARQEREMEALLQVVDSRIAESQEEAALALLGGVSKDSFMYPGASRRFRQVQATLFMHNKVRCQSEHQAGRLEQAIPACRRAMELSCNRPDGADPEAQRLFEAATSRKGWRTEFVCPNPLPYEEGCLFGEDPHVEVERRIRERFPDPRLTTLVIGYFRTGEPGKVAAELRTARAAGADPAVDDAIGALEVIADRFGQWQALMRDERLQDALAKYWEVVNAESRFLPPLSPRTPSRVRQEMASRSSAWLFAQSREALEAGRFDLASPNLMDAYRIDPRNTDVVGVIGQMEREASRRISFEPGCESYRWAAATTRPETAIHKKARQLLQAACGQ